MKTQCTPARSSEHAWAAVQSAGMRVDARRWRKGWMEALDDEAKDHRFAFYMCTIHSPVGPNFNESLRQRSPGALFEAWNPFLRHLVAALRALPDHACTVYRLPWHTRRVHDDPPNLSSYIKSSKVHWSGFSSTSIDPGVAAGFASCGIVFALDVQNAKDIQPFSWFGSDEGELLLNPNMEFVVTKELHEPSERPLHGKGCRVIKLQQIPDDTLCSTRQSAQSFSTEQPLCRASFAESMSMIAGTA